MGIDPAPNGLAMTVGELVSYGESQLNSSPTRRLDTEVLLAAVLATRRSLIIADAQRQPTLAQEARFRHLVSERRNGVPVAYLVGHKEFWSLDFQVTKQTLIPRPETELLVEIALATISRERIVTIADLGTGCGALALAIAHDCDQCRIIAVDCSASALAVARRNAVRFGIDSVQFVAGDWYKAVGEAQFELIVSNPPYLPTDAAELHLGDIRHEPRRALQAGVDGLDAIRRIIGGSAQYLRPGGWLMLEHGHRQTAAIRRLLETAAFTGMQTYQDLAGLDRVTTATSAEHPEK